jgi:DNA-binding beta-propeller fold protein YncE
MKRLAGSVIAFVLAAVMLVACGGKAEIAQVPLAITEAAQSPSPVLVIDSSKAEFNEPEAVTVDEDGNVYVYDGNILIQVFDSSGALLRTIGGRGTDEGMYVDVKDMTIGPDGLLYITDANTCRVTVYKLDGTFVKTFGERGDQSGQFTDMAGVEFNSKGEIYVAGGEMGYVQVFDKKGNYLRTLGEPGEGEGQFVEPGSIAFDSADRIYVQDGERGKILLFGADGTFIREFGESGDAPDQFAGDIEALAIDAFDRLYVVDQDGNFIKVFDKDGNFLANLCEEGSEPGRLDKPQGIAIDLIRGYFIVSEEETNRVQVFNLADLK